MPAQTRARGDEALQARRAAAQGGTPEPEKTPEGSYATRPGGQRRHTAAGRGSAARSKAASPFWVTMEISRRTRAIAAERNGSSAGACCRSKLKKNQKIAEFS